MGKDDRRPGRALIGAAVALVALSGWSIVNASTPHYSPKNSRIISGSLSIDPEHGAALDDVQICSCWQGPANQAQKKVRFRITNNTDERVFRLTGGKEGSIFLLVGYDAEFQPVVTAPPKHQQNDLEGTAGTPANRTVYTSLLESVSERPDEITNADLLEDLSPPSGWRVWAIPANHNMMMESLGERLGTYPTFVEWDDEDLHPGESYEGDELGIGVWTFYVPYPPGLDGMGDYPIPAEWASTSFTDDHYIIFGVAVVDDSGRINGFSPTPPESQWTHGSDL